MNKENAAVTPAVSPAFWTEQQVATYLGMSTKWLQKMRLEGGALRYTKLGNRVRYRIKDVEAYVNASTRASTSESARASAETAPGSEKKK